MRKESRLIRETISFDGKRYDIYAHIGAEQLVKEYDLINGIKETAVQTAVQANN